MSYEVSKNAKIFFWPLLKLFWSQTLAHCKCCMYKNISITKGPLDWSLKISVTFIWVEITPSKFLQAKVACSSDWYACFFCWELNIPLVGNMWHYFKESYEQFMISTKLTMIPVISTRGLIQYWVYWTMHQAASITLLSMELVIHGPFNEWPWIIDTIELIHLP